MELQYQLHQIDAIAEKLWANFSQEKIWAFEASMGAGKTTLIHSLCKNVLQVTNYISSPTFSIINSYHSLLIGNVFHMDWYRLKNEEEAINAGVEETLLSGDICFIEWPSNIQNLLPPHYLLIQINNIGQEERQLKATIL